MKDTIKKTLKITLSNQTIVDLVISGSPSLVDKIDIDSWDVKKEITEMIINGLKLKAQMVFRDEKGHFVNIKKVIEEK